MAEAKAKRDRGGKFVKGSVANPGGRKAVPPEVKEYLQAHTVKAAEKLVALLKSNDANVALKAANSILDRVYGKPETALKVEGQGLGPTVVVIRKGGADG